MSVTIETPDSTWRVGVTLYLNTEQDVLDWAQEHETEPLYLPREGQAANLIIATYHVDSELDLTAIAQVYR